MKKILLAALLIIAGATTFAQTTSRTTTTTHRTYRYYYYPASNVYYDEASGNYWYWDNGSAQWTTVQTLPTNIKVTKSGRYLVNYNGDDPWKNNSDDIRKFKVKKNGKIKIKPAK
jgi:hypothetical protein